MSDSGCCSPPHSEGENSAKEEKQVVEDEEDEDEEDFDDGFGDDLMGNSEDKSKLMSLTVLEREQLLAERQNKRDAWREKYALFCVLIRVLFCGGTSQIVFTKQTYSRCSTGKRFAKC